MNLPLVCTNLYITPHIFQGYLQFPGLLHPHSEVHLKVTKPTQGCYCYRPTRAGQYQVVTPSYSTLDVVSHLLNHQCATSLRQAPGSSHICLLSIDRFFRYLCRLGIPCDQNNYPYISKHY